MACFKRCLIDSSSEGSEGCKNWLYLSGYLLNLACFWQIHSSEGFKADEFDSWVQMGMAPAIQPSLELYKELLDLGFKVVLLTGRSEYQREATTQNLINAGFNDWDRLILSKLDDLVIRCNMFNVSSVIVDIKYGMVLAQELFCFALSKFKAITSRNN
ncbi:Acid phosphatase 1, partial [Cucurbita argyrosperma subsp. argyrosperma]